MSRPRVPGWGMTVGIIMIVTSSLGMFGKLYSLFTLRMLQMFADIDFSSAFEELEGVSSSSPSFGVTPGFITLLYVAVAIGILIGVFNIVAGARMLGIRRGVVEQTKIALGASIGYRILLVAAIFFGARYEMLMGFLIASLIAVVVDITLLIVTVSSNPAAYNGEKESSDAVLDDAIFEIEDL